MLLPGGTEPIKALHSFRDNKTTLLLATPAAARGLDLPAVRWAGGRGRARARASTLAAYRARPAAASLVASSNTHPCPGCPCPCSHVYNMGLPGGATDYLHRAGRSGRIGSAVQGAWAGALAATRRLRSAVLPGLSCPCGLTRILHHLPRLPAQAW